MLSTNTTWTHEDLNKSLFVKSYIRNPSVQKICKIIVFTITTEILARPLANFYCQYADRRMNLKFMHEIHATRQRAIAINSGICYRKKRIDFSF